ncbi:MAG: hypothetical protein QM770_14390 [Tepidisphaeraceae bacterium]
MAAGSPFTGGTAISAGTLLVSNTSGSATGGGAVSLLSGATLGGTGVIAPTGTNSVSLAGFISPGGSVSAVTGGSYANSIGTLTFNLGNTTGTINAAGATFLMQLGSSDTIAITGASAGDLAFSGNVIDLLGTGSAANSPYKLFDTSLDATTWTGLAFDGTTGVISAGLSAINAPLAHSATLLVGTAGNGLNAGDIYVSLTVPEPTAALASIATGGLLLRRRNPLLIT